MNKFIIYIREKSAARPLLVVGLEYPSFTHLSTGNGLLLRRNFLPDSADKYPLQPIPGRPVGHSLQHSARERARTTRRHPNQ